MNEVKVMYISFVEFFTYMVKLEMKADSGIVIW